MRQNKQGRCYAPWVNPLMGTLKQQRNGHSNTVIGTLAVDGWAVTLFWYNEEGPRRAPSSLYQM